MIATKLNQSQRLLACGVDPKTADMMYSTLREISDYHLYAVPWYTPRLPNRKITDNDFPAWSLSALLSLIPTPIFTENRKQFVMSVKRHKGVWFVSYNNAHETLFQSHSDNPIEAVVRAIENLTFHGYQLANVVNFASNKNEKK